EVAGETEIRDERCAFRAGATPGERALLQHEPVHAFARDPAARSARGVDQRDIDAGIARRIASCDRAADRRRAVRRRRAATRAMGITPSAMAAFHRESFFSFCA